MRQPSPRERLLFQQALLAWFKEHGRVFPWRKRRTTLYKLILPEVLLQRTRAEVVAKFLPAFFERFPSWSVLAKASETELQEFLQPLGLWRRRATSLQELAKVMVARGGRFPKDRKSIENLPGVGQYIANAILLFSQGRSEPLLDVNMARVLERCFGSRDMVDIRYDAQLQEVSRLVVSCNEAVQVNWAILDLAALICQQRSPRCVKCPLLDLCETGKMLVTDVP